jgi:hypothetical protein
VKFFRLKPDTEYMARIAIYKDFATRSLGRSTAVIDFRTTSKRCRQVLVLLFDLEKHYWVKT